MQRPVPDEALIRRALRVREATETPMERYIREEHDAMAGAVRVGLDAARKLWPVEREHLPETPVHGAAGWKHILDHFEAAYELLDSVGERVFGPLLTLAYLGQVSEEAILEAEAQAKVGPRYEAQAAPPIGDDGAG